MPPQLPDEVLLHIVQSLPSTSDLACSNDDEDLEQLKITTQTLANLCLVSRSLSAFAQPLLYHTYHKSTNDDPEYVLEEGARFKVPTRLQQFLRTLIQHPNLAAKVMCLRLEDFQDNYVVTAHDGEHYPVDPVLADMFEQASYNIPSPDPGRRRPSAEWQHDIWLQELSAEWQDDWRKELRYGMENAEVTLLLTLVPNLKILDMTTAFEDFGCYVRFLSDQLLGSSEETEEIERWDTDPPRVLNFKCLGTQSSTSLPVFSQLESLILRCELEYETRFMLYDSLNLLTVPTLRSISMYGGQDGFSHEPTEYNLPIQHLTHFRFEGCDSMDRDFLYSLIKCCEQLKSLEIHIRNWELNFGDELFRYLALRSGTLECFRLICSLRHDLSRGDHALTKPPDFREFQRLKSIEIIQDPLLPLTKELPESFDTIWADFLPTSLEELRICKADERFVHHLDNFINLEKWKRLPNLKVMEMSLDKIPSSSESSAEKIMWNASLASCMEHLRGAGIDFKVSVPGAGLEIEYP